MWRLLFLSTISALVATGCSDDCGPGGAFATGLVASSAEVSITYGNLRAGANNDCPDPMAPQGVVSLTIAGTQADAPSIITLCLPRPDLLEKGEIPLGTGGLRIIDFNGEKDGCTFALEPTRVITGTVRSSGMCDNGTNDAGFALTIDGNIGLRRTCPTSTDTIAVALAGTTAVEPQ